MPRHIDVGKIIAAIDPRKDVDGFHPTNVGKMLIGEDGGFLPATPYGIHVMLKAYGIDVAGKHVVVVGRSNIVGKPMAAILLQKGNRRYCHRLPLQDKGPQGHNLAGGRSDQRHRKAHLSPPIW